MNYARQVLSLRQRRDAAVERARSQARRAMEAATIERDREIRWLRDADPSLGLAAIAERVGCSRGQVYEVLNPERRSVYNRRRRDHLRLVRDQAS